MTLVERTEPLAVLFSPLLRRYSLEELWALPEPADRARYELIGGVLFRVPPPEPPHGRLDARLNASLVSYLVALGRPGEVLHPRELLHPREPIYVGDTYLEPDMMYVSRELRERMGDRQTSADIVFEYLSWSTAGYDRTTKADTYLALGIGELWLVDPDTRTIEVRRPVARAGAPAWEARSYGAGELAESRVLPGWRVSVDELFGGL
jgi:Uma2 family endonuclease